MGVYIKGIKTPAIVKVHYLNGRRYVEDPQSGEWREMVDIPPHGRLVDADALITTFCEWGTRLERGRKLVITMSEAKQAIVDIIEDAPTIIPAEEGDFPRSPGSTVLPWTNC